VPEAAARLTTDVESGDGRADIVLRGELDLATVSLAEDAVNGADGAGTVVLDLRGLSFLDSSGLRLILATAESCEGDSRRLYVIRGPAQVNRVLELTGTESRLNLVDDPSAIQS
jgi:anti-anti-sigma factor